MKDLSDKDRQQVLEEIAGLQIGKIVRNTKIAASEKVHQIGLKIREVRTKILKESLLNEIHRWMKYANDKGLVYMSGIGEYDTTDKEIDRIVRELQKELKELTLGLK